MKANSLKILLILLISSCIKNYEIPKESIRVNKKFYGETYYTYDSNDILGTKITLDSCLLKTDSKGTYYIYNYGLNNLKIVDNISDKDSIIEYHFDSKDYKAKFKGKTKWN